MSIDEMPAGREMDVLVAEKVMGWHLWDWEKGDLDCACGKTHYAPQDIGIGYYPRCAEEPEGYLSFSTDIAAAWELVEKWKSIDGQFLNIFWNVTQAGFPNYWTCGMWKSGWTQQDIGTADTAPLAICRAALKVLER
jgi:hypothetical protein